MYVGLLVAALVTLAFALLGRAMARRRNRRQFAWGLTGAILPPVLLVLLFLPARKPA